MRKWALTSPTTMSIESIIFTTLKEKGYYLKPRHPKFRLISCLLDSNKGMNKDFLIISGEWHDSLHCPTREV